MFNVPNKLVGLLLSLMVPTLLWFAYNNVVNPAHVETFLYIWYSILLAAGVFCLFAAYYGTMKKVNRKLGEKLELTPLYSVVVHAFNLYFLFTLYGPILPIMMVVGLRMVSDSLKYIQFRTIKHLTQPPQGNIN